MEPRLLNRRDLLTLPFQLLRPVAEARSQNSLPGTLEATRDKVTEYSAEGLSVLAMLWLAYQGTKDPLVIYHVASESNLSDRKDYPGILQKVEGIHNLVVPIQSTSSNSYNAWYQAYRKTREDCRLVTKSDGKTENECKTVEYWDDPPPLNCQQMGINNEILRHWRNFFTGLKGKTELLQTQHPKTFDLEGGPNALYYPEEVVDSKTQRLWAFLPYSAVGAGFAFYEEILRKLAESNYSEPIVDDQIRIKRRSFLKLMASIGLSLGIRKLQIAFGEKNKDLLKEIKTHNDEILRQLDVPPEKNFQRFFGKTPLEIRNELLQIITRIEAALTSGYEGKGLFGLVTDPSWSKPGGVKENLEALKREAEKTLANFDTYFQWDKETGQYQIPQELTIATGYLWATQQMEKFVKDKAVEVNSRHLLNALVMAGGLAGIMGIAEKGVFPLIDEVLDKAERRNQF